MRVIHILDDVTSINLGVWQAALSTAGILCEMGWSSEAWYFGAEIPQPVRYVPWIELDDVSMSHAALMIRKRNMDPDKDLIVTHGCWKFPTRWGSFYGARNYRWIYVPQGMLEPWAMNHKKWKKIFYYNLFERRMLKTVSFIRAVSAPEKINLQRAFGNDKVFLLPNCINPVFTRRFLNGKGRNFLFMSRLHKKKGVVHLVEGWIKSTLNNRSGYYLFIAGEDEGELAKINRMILGSNCKNILYVGFLTSEGKYAYFEKCSFFVLPSFSEGFPTSVIEAMSAGLIPLISEGCNFPEAFNDGLAYKFPPNATSIASVLMSFSTISDSDLAKKSEIVSKWTKSRYSCDVVGAYQNKIYRSILNNRGVHQINE